jgi:TRAP-type mannitol/chloroaromatic compound transport system substrate-binding protein
MRSRWIALLPLTYFFWGSAHAVDLQFAISWDPSITERIVVGEPFAKNVEAASNGGLKLLIKGPESIPAFEQLQPTRAGAVQLLLTHGAYHYGTTGIGVGLDAIDGPPSKRRDSGVWDMVDKDYQKLGLKLIGMPGSNKRGYHIMLREPLTTNGDLQGRKIRATPTYFPLLKLLGASAVTLSPGEIYTALEKGVIDGTTWPSTSMINTRYYEVAKFMIRPTFGNSTIVILMNLAAFNKLDEGQRKILLDEGRKMEDLYYTEFDRLSLKEEEELKARGVKVTELPDRFKEQLPQIWADGIWSLVEQKNPQEAKDLREAARKAGLTR